MLILWNGCVLSMNIASRHHVRGQRFSVNGVPGARAYSISWGDASGNLYLFGGLGYGSTASVGLFNDLWKYQ
jgi:hypothetical protein